MVDVSISQQIEPARNPFEQEIQDLIEYTETLRKFVPVPLCFTTPKGVITDVNDKFLSTFGYSMQSIIGKDIVTFFMEKDKAISLFNALLAEEKVVDVENSFTCYDGSISPVMVSAMIRKDKENEVEGIIMSLIDIKARKEVEASLKQKTLNLEQLNKMMVGRELKMIELKKEIERLKTKT